MVQGRPQAAFFRDHCRRRYGPPRRGIIAGLQIDDFLYPVAAAQIEAVKATLALAPGVAVGDHPRQQLGRTSQGVEGIVVGQRGCETRQDMRHQIEADQIEQPENAGSGNSGGPPEHGVGPLDADALAEGLSDGGMEPEGADPVGDKTGRVLCGDHGFPHVHVGEGADALLHGGIGIGADDDLHQPHVAGWIEEVSDQEAAAHVVVQTLRQHPERQGRGVRGDGRAGLQVGLDGSIERLFDVGPLDDRFDDPVAVCDQGQVAFRTAGGYPAR